MSAWREQRFCSRRCGRLAQPPRPRKVRVKKLAKQRAPSRPYETKVCAHCAFEYGPPARTKHGWQSWDKSRFCSLKCYRDETRTPVHQRGRRPYAIYQKYRLGFCERCFLPQEWIPQTLHVHHVDADPYNNEPENLETLCRECHLDTHREMRKAAA